MNKMIVANLAYRPIRSIISIVAVAIEVTLILLIVGFSLGMLNDNNSRQKGIGADIMVRPPNASMFNAFSGAPMPVKIGDIIAKEPHVEAVAPVIMWTTSTTNIEVIDGIDLPSFEAIGGPLTFLKGGPFQGPDDMIVDDLYASGNKATVGTEVELFNHKFRICGVIPHGRGARRYVQMETLQRLTGNPGKASAFYVRLDDSRNTDAAVEQLRKTLTDYKIMSMKDYVSLMSPDKIPMLSTFINIVVGIAVVIGFIVIFQSMYTAVMERTREIGILKSLGASKLYIVRVVLRETLALAIAGIVVGILLSLVAGRAIHARVPTLPVQFTSAWILRATLIAIAGAMVGALYPAYKAAQKDPIDALAYE